MLNLPQMIQIEIYFALLSHLRIKMHTFPNSLAVGGMGGFGGATYPL